VRRVQRFRLRHLAHTRLWLLPLTCVVAGVALALVERVISWGGYIRLAFDELQLAGAGSPQVARRLRAALEDLKRVAPPERQPPLDRQLELLEAGVRRAYDAGADVDAALVPDMQGIGSGPDVMSHPPGLASPPAPDVGRPLADTAGARHD
jgi:uncharacterized membrane protein